MGNWDKAELEIKKDLEECNIKDFLKIYFFMLNVLLAKLYLVNNASLSHNKVPEFYGTLICTSSLLIS